MKLLALPFRVLGRFRLYSIVNMLGLAISLASVIVIARYINQETTVNHFASDLKHTYILSIENPEDGRKRFGGATVRAEDNIPFPPLLNNPSVKNTTTFFAYEEDFIVSGNHRINVKAIAADSNFFKILPFPIRYGSHKMIDPSDAIITEKFAQKLFGKENPIGKKFTHSSGDELKVVGVTGKPSSKSFLAFDILLDKDQRQFMAIQAFTLIKLHTGADVRKLNDSNRQLDESRSVAPNPVRLQLFPLKDFYFDRTHEVWKITRNNDLSVFVKGNRNAVKILLVVGILILLVGLFNFINIYTVITLKRGKEFGVKKIFGAGKGQIFWQIYGENLLMTLIAVFLAWFFIEIAQSYLSTRLNFEVIPNPVFSILFSVLILIFLPLITSLHPYLRYHYSKPIASLQSVYVRGVSLASRKTFLFLQYVITFGLIVIALFFMKQLNYMLAVNPGYNTKDVIMARMMHRDMNAFRSSDMEAAFRKISENATLVRDRMNKSPLFSDWEFGLPVYNLEAKVPMKRSDRSNYQPVSSVGMSPQYMKMFGFQLKEGRLWDSTDVNGEFKYIINESAAKLFEITDIRTVKLESQYKREGETAPIHQVVGIIKDFHTGHLSKTTTPLVISYTERGFHFDYLMARFVPGKQKEALAYLENLYKEINNDAEFTYSLLEDDIAKLYEEDKRISRVYLLFSIIAILVSCMGLFAISVFDIRQRYREIALRKVNGATTNNIMHLFLNKYLMLLAVSFLTAIPISYVVISKHLENFAYKISVSLWIAMFSVISVIIVIFVSLLTLVWQIKTAMRTNPANALKLE